MWYFYRCFFVKQPKQSVEIDERNDTITVDTTCNTSFYLIINKMWFQRDIDMIVLNTGRNIRWREILSHHLRHLGLKINPKF